jgi:hypothetical protein
MLDADDPNPYDLARGTLQYLRLRRPVLAHLLDEIAAGECFRTREYIEAILHDKMPEAGRLVPAQRRIQRAAAVCICTALQDTHRHQ